MKRNLRNLMVLSLAAGSLAMYSCRDGEEKKDDPAEPMQNDTRHEGEMQDDMGQQGEIQSYRGEETTAEFQDENTAKAYELYIAIKDALVNTDAETAQNKAEELSEVLEQESQEASVAASAIAESSDVNAQREAFSDLTASMEEVLKGALSSGEIYKQFCPMAFEGKGDYWYSNSKEIYNPYYGEKMLKCGRVDATLN